MIKDKICTNCGAAFKCGPTEADHTCWCTALPNIVPMTEGAECLCQVCLKKKISQIQESELVFKPQKK